MVKSPHAKISGRSTSTSRSAKTKANLTSTADRNHEETMSLVILTRPDGSPIAINPDEIVHLAPVPTSGPLMGPLTAGTRIVFRNQTHQDVKELIEVVVQKINDARNNVQSAIAHRFAAARLAQGLAAPTYNDIVNLLSTLVNNDPNISAAPHDAFWLDQNTGQLLTETAFLALQTDDWGLGGPLVVPGNPNASPLFQALSGTSPFDGSQFPQMPDTGKDPMGRHATPQELLMVKNWIQSLPTA
jgi:hypothetical protein